jgi:hypothetical protein
VNRYIPVVLADGSISAFRYWHFTLGAQNVRFAVTTDGANLGLLSDHQVNKHHLAGPSQKQHA